MRKWNCLTWLLLVMLGSLLLSGCGSSSTTSKVTDPPAYQTTDQTTGDIALFPNASLLATADDLANPEVVILDARPKKACKESHIPGAVCLDWRDYVDGSMNLKPIDELERQLSDAGLTRQTRMVLYDDTTASWGAAGRVFWMLEYLGADNVQILNGGWDKWLADGGIPETTVNTLPAATFEAQLSASVNVDAEHVKARLADADFVVVDTRTDEEFNGWQLYGEPRGGHVPGAVQLPYAWYYNEDKTVLSHADLKQLLESRGVTSDKEVAAYCTVGIRSGFFYFLTRLMGYPRTANWDGSIVSWAGGDEAPYPMEKLEKYQELVYPSWVRSLIDYHATGSTSDAPDNYPYGRDHKYLIFETQWGSFEDMNKGWADDSYLKGHIPGAIHSNSDTYENGYPRWFMLPDDELQDAVGSMGITADTTVVVYSNSPIFASRLWWILKYAGVEDVRLLNGGDEAWTAAGFEGEMVINEPTPATFVGTVHPEYLATTDYVSDNYSSGSTILADVRTYEEYLGEKSGYSYVVNKGRIPGAVYAFNADNPDRKYLDGDGTLRSYTEVGDMWKGLGIESTGPTGYLDKEVVFYCGSGYRSSLSFLYAYLMGYQNVRNYSDGWEGWSTHYIEDASYMADPDLPGSTDGWIQDPSGRPVETGEPNQ